MGVPQDYGLQAGQKHPGLVNKVTSSLMDELSHVLIPQAEFKNQHDTSSCAVVYSSEQALHDSEFGDAIDKHKTVFRFGQVKEATRPPPKSSLPPLGWFLCSGILETEQPVAPCSSTATRA